jgi:hypothetical protein
MARTSIFRPDNHRVRILVSAIAGLVGASLSIVGLHALWVASTTYSIFGKTLFQARVEGAAILLAGLVILVLVISGWRNRTR